MKYLLQGFLVSIICAVLLGSTIETKRCSACHGLNFEKQALGVSRIVKNMNREEILKALRGYKDGTYGNSMRGIMKFQLKMYSDKQLVQISKKIKEKKN